MQQMNQMKGWKFNLDLEFLKRLKYNEQIQSIQYIDCFELSSMPSDIVCIDIDTNGNFYLGYQIWWFNPDKYGLIRNASHMKIISGLQPEPNTQPFDGLLEGVAITAAFNWTQLDKEFVYLFAGRHLCRQEISFQWVPMCEIQDISDWINCSKDVPEYGSTLGPKESSTDRPNDSPTDDPKDGPTDDPKDSITDGPKESSTDSLKNGKAIGKPSD